MTTIFDKIISGEVPCHKVHEDERVLSFLDVAPLAPGHTLVIPKRPVAQLHDLPDEDAAAIGRVLPRICRAVMQATGTRAYNVLQNNGELAHQAVMHVHFHVIPKPDDKNGLGVRWSQEKLGPDAAALATRIRELLTTTS